MAVRWHHRPGVTEIILDSPDTKNALDDSVVAELIDGLRRVAGTPDVDAVVLRGAGGVFCSGGSFDELAGIRRMVGAPGGADAVHSKVRANSRLVEQLRDQPQRTIAVLDGAVVGAGIGVAAACDMRIASPAALVIGGFDRVGVSSDMGVAPLLRAAVGLGAASRLLLDGERWDAQTAHELGFISEVHSGDDLSARLDALLAAVQPGDGVRTRLQRHALDDPATLAAALDREARLFAASARASGHEMGPR